MNSATPRVRILFEEALERPTGAEREAYLDGACAGDLELRASVESLLRAHEEAGSFLATPPIDRGSTAETVRLCEQPGTVVGNYTLGEQIGEGGMGVVFRAEQTAPVRRSVAFKIIKPGMDSRQVIARFETERQVVAMMDHPHIAKVLDAGTTENGLPYFVMELVKGVPITRYCDDKKLTLAGRLELFAHVCHAVQHAHQKGIIHRDLKPTNVLVAEYDGRAVPKVIDFGVAKAMAQELTGPTMATGIGQLVGTFEYMSPEQTQFNQLDIDTRSDIYSLGVLLYELIAGSTPFERGQLADAPFEERLRIIREEEPPKLSTRLSSSDSLPTVATQRQTEPARLAREVRGELEWIVAKALAKDRNQRYATAGAFAADIERYLRNEPVEAGPPSARYRLAKFARRNRGEIAAASVAMAAILATLVGLYVNNRLIAREKGEKERALVRAVDEKERADANLVRAREAVKQYLVLASENPLLASGDFLTLRQELLETALPFYEEFVRQEGKTSELELQRGQAYEDLGFLRQETGDIQRALEDLKRAEGIYRHLAAEFPERPEYRHRLAETLNSLGNVEHQRSRLDVAEQLFGEGSRTLEELEERYPERAEFRESLARVSSNLGILLRDRGEMANAEEHLRRAIALREKLISGEPARQELYGALSQAWLNLGTILHAQRRLGEAEKAYQQVEKVFESLLSSGKVPEQELPFKYQQIRAQGLNNLGILYRAGGQVAESERVQRQAIALKEKLAAKFPSVPDFRRDLARSYNNLATLVTDPAEARKAIEESLEIYAQLVTDFPEVPAFAVEYAGTATNLGRQMGDEGELAESLPILGESIDALERALAADDRVVKVRESLLVASWTRAMTLAGLGRFEEALPDWDRAIELDEGPYAISLRLKRASTLLQMKDHAKAATGLSEIVAAAEASGDDLLLAACGYAMASQLAEDDPSAGESYAASAVAALRKAIEREVPVARIAETSELDKLRSREDFKELLGEGSENKSSTGTNQP